MPRVNKYVRKRSRPSAAGYSSAKRSRTSGAYRPSRRMRNARTGGFAGMEYKFLDCAWNSVALASSTDGSGGELQPSTGSTNNISTPAVGDGESNRDGRKFTIWSAWVSGLVNFTGLADQADPSEGPTMVFALVLDTQANGATINSEDVFINPTTVGEGMLPTPLRNLANTTRFRVLAMKTVRARDLVAMTDGASTAAMIPSGLTSVNLTWKSRKGLIVKCSGTTADIASVADNALHVVAFASDTTYTPVFRGKSRVRFTG